MEGVTLPSKGGFMSDCNIVDRRHTSKGSKATNNRERFIRRIRGHIKKQVKNLVQQGNVTDILTNTHRSVKIPIDSVDEPSFVYDPQLGDSEFALAGNTDFSRGDLITRPERMGSGNGAGSGSGDGEGESEFSFVLTKEEFLEYFFDDLNLPNIEKTELVSASDFKIKRSGYSPSGTPNRLDVMQTMKQSVGRRFAMRNPKKKKLKELESQLQNLLTDRKSNATLIAELEKQIAGLKRKIRAIPFIDNEDLRYRNFKKYPEPSFSAVMICLMDISGSMGEHEQDLSKRFFILLYLFLVKNYKSVEIRFVRYHSVAKEVSEEEFFHSRETGGTILSTGLEETLKIVKSYPRDKYNIYVAHASDGDNWLTDNEVDTCKSYYNQLLLLIRDYFYIEVHDRYEDLDSESEILTMINNINIDMKKMHIRHVSDVSEIYPVFRSLFEGNANGN